MNPPTDNSPPAPAEKKGAGVSISPAAVELAEDFHQVFVLGGNPFSRTGLRPIIGLTSKEKRARIQAAMDEHAAPLLEALVESTKWLEEVAKHYPKVAENLLIRAQFNHQVMSRATGSAGQEGVT